MNSKNETDFTRSANPFALFESWMQEAGKTEINDPNAMSVATVDENGMPDVRILLLKGFSPKGFVFYTNQESTKGHQLATHPLCALCFHWKSLRRQIRVRGSVVGVSDAEADAYFNSRSWGSRIGAWASMQSRPLEDRATLERRVQEFENKYPEHESVPRPPYWSGYRLEPVMIEFWQDRPFRLHDRIIFRKNTKSGGAARLDDPENWEKQQVYP